MEKAYAKFRGGYEKIHGGLIEIAFQDFTGGLIETLDLMSSPDSAVRFFKIKLKKNALLGASIIKSNSIPNQLPSGHAYRITGAAKYRNTPLIRIRNPWGNFTEWRGA